MTNRILAALAVVFTLFAAPVRAADVKTMIDRTTLKVVLSIMEMELKLNGVKASMAQRVVEAKAADKANDFLAMQRITEAAVEDSFAIAVAERHATMSLRALALIGSAYDWCRCKPAPEVISALKGDYLESLNRSLATARDIDRSFEVIRALHRG